MKCLRKLKSATGRDKVRNDNIKQKLDAKPVNKRIEK